MSPAPTSRAWTFEEFCLVGLVFIACTSFAVMLLLSAIVDLHLSWRGVVLAGLIGAGATALIVRRPTP